MQVVWSLRRAELCRFWVDTGLTVIHGVIEMSGTGPIECSPSRLSSGIVRL